MYPFPQNDGVPLVFLRPQSHCNYLKNLGFPESLRATSSKWQTEPKVEHMIAFASCLSTCSRISMCRTFISSMEPRCDGRRKSADLSQSSFWRIRGQCLVLWLLNNILLPAKFQFWTKLTSNSRTRLHRDDMVRCHPQIHRH